MFFRQLLLYISLFAAPFVTAQPVVKNFTYGGTNFKAVIYDLKSGEYSPSVVCEERLRSVRTIISEYQPDAAITGTFFAWETGQPVGEVTINGDTVSSGARGCVIGVDWLGKVHIADSEAGGWFDWFPYRYGIRAAIRILKDGQVNIRGPRSQGFRDTHIWGSAARTSVGVKADGSVILLATTGAVTLSKLAGAHKHLGAVDAANLDGGGSTMLFHNGSYLYGTGRPLCNLFVIYKRSPYDVEYLNHLNRLARNQTNGAATGIGTGR